MAYLNKPLKAGPLFLKNRLVMPPMATSKAEIDGKVSPELLSYYEEKSKGGNISLIIIEHSFVCGDGKANPNQLSAAEDSMIEGLSILSGVIRQNGSKTVMQLNHSGSTAIKEVTGRLPWGPSAIVNPRKGKDIPEELDKKAISEVITAFQRAAVRAKEAGFDGVEIHSAHGYLLNQFFSPLTNKRTDEYGGNVANRIRLHLEIIQAIKKTVGSDFAMLLRLGASDYTDGGITIEDSKIAAVEFEKAGIDILDISGGFCGYAAPEKRQGYFSDLTQEIKSKISIPVILTGGITEAKAAEQLLSEGKADLIGVGRAILKDSNWANNAIKSLE